MKNTFVAKVEIDINASASEVWDALTNPEIIKQYFFGTDAISDWKAGSSLQFKGSWEGKEYLDKGIILEVVQEKLFRYNYLSSFSGLEDKQENYANISYALTAGAGRTKLVVTQDNIATEDACTHSKQNWKYILEGMKKLIEKK